MVVDKYSLFISFSMKPKFIRFSMLIAALAAAPAAFAQTGATYTAGSSSSSYGLSLGTYYSFNLGYSTTYLGMNLRPGGNGWLMGTDMANNGGAMITTNVGGALTFITIPTTNPSGTQSLTDAQVINYARMQITPSGQVRIGVQAPSSQHNDYRLSVDGKLVAKSIYVTQPSTWADFVFAPDYRLMPLAELATYLQRNHHLPTMPSAQEVAANGYSVGEMDTKLLQSVEELTLHVLELSKQNARMQNELTALRAQMARKSTHKKIGN
jgi:hypothetical protein